MAKAKTHKIPVSSVTGPIGTIDRTLGREGGLALNMTDKTADGTVKLGVKTAMPPGGSIARHAAVESYCECDRQYGMLDAFHINHLVQWFYTSRQISKRTLTAYMIWIKVCCLHLPEKDYFVHNAWYGRWLLVNDTAADLVNYYATIRGMRIDAQSPLDAVVCILDSTWNVSYIVVPVARGSKTLSFYLPLVPAHSRLFLDVYWYLSPPPYWVQP